MCASDTRELAAMTDPKKFDPAKAALLDAPERERILPTARIIDLLELSGDETVVDYGAGTGRIAIAAALEHGGRILAVDESPEMIEHLRARLTSAGLVEPLLVEDNNVPLVDGVADRIVAVNLLHEVRGERALAEMRRLLAPAGFALVVDWERGRERNGGPPDELLYSGQEAQDELRAAGFDPVLLSNAFRSHFAIRAEPV
ncbi:MAG: hypothetical protein NVSMB25_10390 [Thermoleophilaceae bacterium]